MDFERKETVKVWGRQFSADPDEKAFMKKHLSFYNVNVANRYEPKMNVE